ncbi:MAG: hypothetical protein AB1916_16020 [Thermodesulfobacteriota bacterium]
MSLCHSRDRLIYANAVRRLESYLYVGFVETFQESILQLSERIGIPLSPDVFVNKSRQGGMVTDAFVDSGGLADLDAPDFRLYRHFKDREGDQEGVAQSVQAEYYAEDLTARGWLDAADPGQVAGSAKAAGTGAFDQVQVLSMKLKLGLDDETYGNFVAKHGETAIDAIEPAQVCSAWRYEILEQVLDRLMSAVREDVWSSAVVQAQHLLCYLAATPQARADGTSEELFLRAMRLNPEQSFAKYAYAVWLRCNGRPQDALRVLGTVPPEQRTMIPFYAEYVATLYTVAGREAVLEFLAGENAVQQIVRTSRTILRNSGLSDRPGTASLSGKRVLVVRSGPEVLLEELLAELEGVASSVTLLVQESFRKKPRYGGRSLLFLNDGMFRPDDSFPDRARLFAGSYDCVIYLCSSFDMLNGLSNFVLFFRQADVGEGFAYPLHNIYLPARERYLIPIPFVEGSSV